MSDEIRGSAETSQFLAYLRSLDVQLTVDSGRLACNAPKGVLTPELHRELKSRKAEILDSLRRSRRSEEQPATSTDEIDWGYSSSLCIHQCFEEQAARTPTAIAVICAGGRLTYNELSIRSNRLANRLRAMGLGPEGLTAICLNRSADVVVALLAVMKAGGAYVPLDPQFPRERLEFMIEDSGAAIVVTEEQLLDVLPRKTPSLLCLDRDRQLVERESAERPPAETRPDNLAYVIYTSGSTGKPKGVEVEHRAVVNLLASMRTEPGISDRDRLLAVTTLSFDIAGLEIYLPLIAGAQLTIAPRACVADGAALARLLRESGATLMQATPVTWRLLLDSGWEGLPGLKMLCGGEAMPRELANRLLATGGELWNLYGPTETTIWSTVHRVDSRLGAVPIGKPIANTQLYVLDEQRQAVLPGTAGELYIGGDGLARGYRRLPETTEERFVADPFQPGKRLYRTGDLVRGLSDGNLEYLGRQDQQIKLRGYRIELGEIEAALEQQPSVRQAVVVAREDEPGDQRLAAYVISSSPGEAALLREALAARLPEYMVPSAFVFLDAFPLTPNKKVDRSALPIPGGQASTRPRLVGSGTENKVAAIWRSLLKVSEVGLHDNFFELGGHSLLIVQLQNRIRQEFSRELSVAELFQRPTVAQIADLLDSAKEAASHLASDPWDADTGSGSFDIAPIKRIPRDGTLPLSSAQLRLWFLDQLTPGGTTYILPVAVRLRGDLDLPALEWSLSQIVRRHEVLRTVFRVANGRPSQVILAPAPLHIKVVDLSQFPLPDREAKAHQIAAAEARQPFDLSKGPLFRTQVLRLDEEEHVLVITVHHTVFDAWSLEVFWREFSALYNAFRDGGQAPLAELPIQFADFSSWQERSLEGVARESHLAYWKRQLGGRLPVLDLPADKPRQQLQSPRAARRTLHISAAVGERLKSLSQGEGASLFMTLLAAINIVLHRLSGQDDILVGTPIASRNRVELEGMIGFFVNTVVVRTDLSGSPSFRELLTRVRDTVLDGHAHQEMPFEELVKELDPERDLTRTPLFQVFFNHLNVQVTPPQIRDLTVEQFHEFELGSKFDLTLYVSEQDKAINLVLVYNADLFDECRMDILLDQYRCVLEQICDYPDRTVNQYSLVTESMRDTIPDPAAPLELRWAGSALSRFMERATEEPGRTAIQDENARWSYGQIETLSAGLAAWLRAHGIVSGDTVAVYGHRSAPLVLALLGTLRAGAAFCILDPAFPGPRLASCLRAAKPKAWLRIAAAVDPPADLETAIAETAGSCRLTLPRAPEIFSIPELSARCDPSDEVDPDNPAYVTFTSGTTGEPKCVLGTHRPLSHFIDWHVRQFGLNDNDRFSMLSGLAHDPLLRDVFSPLWVGGTLCIPSHDDIFMPGRLSSWMQQHLITIAHLTPAMASLLTELSEDDGIDPVLPALRYVFFGGDVLTLKEVPVPKV